MILILLLIAFFIGLIGWQLFHAFRRRRIEGMETSGKTTDTTDKTTATDKPTSNTEYQPYNLGDPNNYLILAQQNAGNIEVLKGRMDGLDKASMQVITMQQQIDLMQSEIDQLMQQQVDYAQEIAGTSVPLSITGTSLEDGEGEDEEEGTNNY